jgi:NCS1 family nucleobase:cation symporter-1
MSEEHLYKDQVLEVEPHGIEPVKDAERHGHPFNAFTLWFGANVEFATLTTGALMVGLFGMSFWQGIISVVIGNLIGVFFLGVLSTFGPQLGIPQLIQSRRAFGFAGNYLPALLNFIAGVGWFAVNSVLGIFALMWLLHIGFVVSLIIMAVIQILFAIYGHNMIHAFERVMAVVLTILFIIVTVFALQHINPAFAMNAKAPAFSGFSGSLILSIGVAFSYILGWMAFASDYTRYLPKKTSPGSIFWNVFLSTLISCVWIEGLGVGLATIKAINVPTDLVTNLLPYGLGVFAMIAVVLGTMTANVLNIYSGALSILAIDLSFVRAIFPKRWVAALVLGVLGAILCLVGQSGYYTKYSDFLLLLAYWVAPWLAIVFFDYLVVNRGRQGLSPFYNRATGVGPGFWAFIIGIVVSVPFFNQSLYTGPIAAAHPGLGDISYYVSFVVAAVIYLIFGRYGVKSDS